VLLDYNYKNHRSDKGNDALLFYYGIIIRRSLFVGCCLKSRCGVVRRQFVIFFQIKAKIVSEIKNKGLSLQIIFLGKKKHFV
jgi:hypothetical protein